MKYFSTVAALVSVIPGIMSMTINTPSSVVQCQPQLLSWADGQGPYYLTIIPGGQPSAAPLKSFDTQSGTSITWIVDLKAGTQVTFSLKDSTGATSYTDIVTIQPNSDSSCLSGSASTDPKTSGNSGSGNSGNAVATQATDATSSVAGGTTGSASTSRAAVAASSGTSRPATTQSPVSVSAQRTTSVAVAAGTSASTSSSTASGAESRFSLGGYLVAGALGLVGAIIL